MRSALTLNRVQLHHGGIVLLLLYVLFYLLPPGLIPHAAHHHEDHHDEFAEGDPCHIAIYHPGAHGGCDHKYHLTPAEDTCPLCHIVLARQAVPEQIRWIDIEYASPGIEINSLVTAACRIAVSFDNKGPPCYES